MIKNQQVKILWRCMNMGKTQEVSAAKSDMDTKTARKYIRSRQMPSEMAVEHDWPTRKDAFESDWPAMKGLLETNSGLQAKTIFQHYQREYPGRYQDNQIRTLQRRIKEWRGTSGPSKEVCFAQIHEPGKLGESDFTNMSKLGITLGRQRFDHLMYHFVLTYSNWETGTICFSESFESLSEGIENALFTLGGVPQSHRTDCLSAAVHQEKHPEDFKLRYQGLLAHYGIAGEKTNPSSPNENGDIEQRNNRFKEAVDQALMLRGSRDFETRKEYEVFLTDLFRQLNSGRSERLKEEMAVLRSLPDKRLNACRKEWCKVSPSSLVYIQKNIYSVHGRLIGETVEARVYGERIEIWYGQKRIDQFPRLRGSGKHQINYRHIIEGLIRKPGAFEDYRYREDLYPSSVYRMAYDQLCGAHTTSIANKEYLKILHLAAKESESEVGSILQALLLCNEPITLEKVSHLMGTLRPENRSLSVVVPEANLNEYDHLIPSGQGVSHA